MFDVQAVEEFTVGLDPPKLGLCPDATRNPSQGRAVLAQVDDQFAFGAKVVLTDAQYVQWTSGHARIFAHSCVEYSDIAGKRRVTEVCGAYSDTKDGIAGAPCYRPSAKVDDSVIPAHVPTGLQYKFRDADTERCSEEYHYRYD